MNFVTVFTSMNRDEAMQIKLRLEAAGFHSELTGETALTALYPGFLGKADVQVPDEEANDALELLKAEE